ncbi:tail protein X [Aggregatibacter actinomycetemcomitans]|uniref:tail protein X n=1 Tax=Aggregatibacter actinomycetemcomitans TaxID=714 RepID=UPI00197BDFBF|nr:tail protein X [Aggregatibacter actinomycetemcomitans]MBN6064183.1 tail protein X [Aggregatibacter actinomycetemcomitans]MBN6081260.1 tail protein X [Aggregatibacter actinomycetemcomitans]MBN6084026.1 tail protein X [Aggregatibacter actinomycetemcomitans]
MKVRAQQNDNLDAILYRYFGKSEGLLEIACELNPHLMDKPIIPIGTEVTLPEADTEKISVAQDTIQLWS